MKQVAVTARTCTTRPEPPSSAPSAIQQMITVLAEGWSDGQSSGSEVMLGIRTKTRTEGNRHARGTSPELFRW